MKPSPKPHQRATFEWNPDQLLCEPMFASPDITYALLYGPGGSGKSYYILSKIFQRALVAPGSRHAVLRAKRVDCETTLFNKTLREVLTKSFPANFLREEDVSVSRMVVRLPPVTKDGPRSEIHFKGLDEHNQGRQLGDEFSTLWFNECNDFQFQQVSTMFSRARENVSMVNGEKLAPKIIFDCNPRWFSDWDYKAFILGINPATGDVHEQPSEWANQFLDTQANQANLAANYGRMLRQGTPADVQRYAVGYWSNSAENALFQQDIINEHRVPRPRHKDGTEFTAREVIAMLAAQGRDLQRVIIAVDPAVTANAHSDSSGIIVAGIHRDEQGDEHVYILHDGTLKDVPDQVCRRVAELYREWGACGVVFEKNQGGLWLEATMRKTFANVPLSFADATTTTGGKLARAEPVSAHYSRGLVHHVGTFQALEEQMTQYGGKGASKSPDRMDALVWAVTKLADLAFEQEDRGGYAHIPLRLW